MNNTQNYLTTLTPLRGIAALLVVIFHCNLMLMPFVPPGFTNFVTSGWLWVDFFFILSGFIISYVYSKYFSEKITWSKYKKFVGARFARVYPLHFVTTILAFIVVIIIVNKASSIDPFFQVILNPKSLPECLLLIQGMNIYITPPLNTPSWSLSTEWWVYMLFPIFVPVFANLKRAGRLIALIIIIAFYLYLRYFIGPIAQPFPSGQPGLNLVSDFGFLRCLAGFLAGMLLFEYYKNKAAYNLFKRSWCFVVLFLATIICMHFGVMDFIIIAIFPFILLAAAYNTTSVKRILDTKPLQRLGDWSFSIYMVHVPIIFSFYIIGINKDPGILADMQKPGPPPNYAMGGISCVVIVALTLVAAAISYRFIEVPARNYLNNTFRTKAKKLSLASVEI